MLVRIFARVVCLCDAHMHTCSSAHRTQAMGWAIDIIGNGMAMGAMCGVPPNGFNYADIYYTIYGIQLVRSPFVFGVV